METMTFSLKPDQKLNGQTKELVELAAYYEVTTPEQSVEASEFLARIQKLRRWIAGIYKEAKQPLSVAKRTLDAQENALLEPLAEAETTVMNMIVQFNSEQSRIKQQLEKAALIEAQAVAKAERDRQATILLQVAIKSDAVVADSLIDQAAMIELLPLRAIPAPVIMEQTLSVGMQKRVTYSAKVVSMRDLVLGVAAQIMYTEYDMSKETRDFLTDNFLPTPQCSIVQLEAVMPQLNILARALKNDLCIPGVVLEKSTTLVAK